MGSNRRNDRGVGAMKIDKLGITPGPWKVSGAYDHIVYQEGNEDPRAVICESWERRSNQKAKPENINLIAAAPEMLEALIAEWFFLDKFLGSNASLIDGFWYGNMCKRQEDIQREIEKATGKSWEEVKELVL